MRKFRDLKISRKITYAFLVITIIAAIAGALGVAGLMTLKQSNKSLYNEDTLALQYAGSTGLDFQQLRYDAMKLSTIDLKDPAVRSPVTDEMKALMAMISNNLVKIEDTIGDAEILQLFNDLKANWVTYNDATVQTVDSVKDGDPTFMLQAKPANAQLGTALRDQFQQFFQSLSNKAAAASNNDEIMSNTIIIVVIAVMALVVVMSLFLGARVSNGISRPLKTLSRVAEHLADGDTDVHGFMTEKDMQYKNQKDEIGKFALAFDKLIGNSKKQVEVIQAIAQGDLTVETAVSSDKDLLGQALVELTDSMNELIGTISTASDQVTSGAALVSNSSMSLSQGATEQASSVQQLTAALDEVAAKTNKNAKNAEEANDYARKAKENAASGNTQMQDMLGAMEEISRASGNINKIIKVIDDIAFQTNILALNAAVEAARAGQHGKGFAVVAEEVRTLAAKSAGAAKETTDMIESSIRKVQVGTKIANDTASALKEIVEHVAKAADLVDLIAAASSEQASAIEQINLGITQVSQIVQTNAATAEESAAASEELSSQADRLKETIRVFKVKLKTLHRQINPAVDGDERLLALKSGVSVSLGGDEFGKY